MPGMITHYLCGQLSLDRLGSGYLAGVIRRNRQMYNLGTQGPDFFFYYAPSLWNRRIAGVGSVLHSSKVGKFFACMVREVINTKDKKEREAALAYLAGYLTHYALDTNAHPYIYYKSGFKTKGDMRPKLSYSIAHRNFETALDTLMLRLVNGEKPAHRKLWRLVHIRRDEALSSAQALSRCLNIVYDIKSGKGEIYAAMRSMYLLTWLLQALGGKRKSVVMALEGLALNPGLATSMIHDQRVKNPSSYLNSGREAWHYPWEDDKQHNTSFVDMFEAALDDAHAILYTLEELMMGRVGTAEFLKLVGNRSLKSGQDCDADVRFVRHAGAMSRAR